MSEGRYLDHSHYDDHPEVDLPLAVSASTQDAGLNLFIANSSVVLPLYALTWVLSVGGGFGRGSLLSLLTSLVLAHGTIRNIHEPIPEAVPKVPTRDPVLLACMCQSHILLHAFSPALTNVGLVTAHRIVVLRMRRRVVDHGQDLSMLRCFGYLIPLVWRLDMCTCPRLVCQIVRVPA
jgi:hypothetical protein